MPSDPRVRLLADKDNDISRAPLPGIGERFDLHTDDGWTVAVVVHHTGRRDVYLVAPREDDPRASVMLTDRQARSLGAILGGSYFQPAAIERVEEVVGGLLIDWLPVEEGAPGAGRTIAALEIRVQTGMTIVAILRAGDAIIAPGPEETVQVGDMLVVAGKRDDRTAFVRHVLGSGDG